MNGVWASAYTLKDLELPGSDEEFLVVCKDERGMLCVPKNNFKDEHKCIPIRTTKITREEIPKAISKLVHDGFEPDYYRIKGLKEYRIGCFERNLTRFCYYIDRSRNDRRAIFDDHEMH